ncbi:hypothetical protein [Burkholderia contaminans]|uniref:hypothetical protein n=1 Tax=Burkholderia contaminans TaxID=488447 RepID=UPI0014543218|nr:hypothetical protein [Burkholderia contaminans]VWD20393.1 putative phage coiled coil domain-containing protein [Burkholderia contaminans]
MTTATELTVVERAAVALTSSERETTLRELVAKSTDMVEIKNAAARDQVHGAAMTLRTARVDIQKAAKTARDDANAFSKAVIAEENRLIAITEPEEKRLIGLRDVWDELVAAEKQAKLDAELRRVAAIREHIDDIRAIAVRVAGCTADQIQIEITDLVALGIDVPRFAELTGEAEMVRGTTLDKLRELHTAAVAREAEAARLRAEREELDRQRAALAEQQRQEAEARAERERAEAAARAQQERADRERRDAEEAARRAEHERDSAARAAQAAAFEEIRAIQHQVLIAHTGRAGVRKGGTIECIRETLAETEAWIIDDRFGALIQSAEAAKLDAIEQIRQLLESAEASAAEHAEMVRRQEELDRAEREQREREEAAARETREREEAAAREQQKRERDDFLVCGPGLDAIVATLAAHYDVESSTVLYWLALYDVELPVKTAPQAA